MGDRAGQGGTEIGTHETRKGSEKLVKTGRKLQRVSTMLRNTETESDLNREQLYLTREKRNLITV